MGKFSLFGALISVTQLPSCLKKEKSFLETEMRERKVEKQRQGAQKGVGRSLPPLGHTCGGIKQKCHSVSLPFHRKAGGWCCGERDGVTGGPCSREIC